METNLYMVKLADGRYLTFSLGAGVSAGPRSMRYRFSHADAVEQATAYTASTGVDTAVVKADY